MTKITATSLIAAVAALLSFASPGNAGELILDSGSPIFTPPENFSANTIDVDTTQPDLIHIKGNATLMPVNGDSATIMVSGTFSATAGEMFSVAYRFAADLSAGTAATYSLEGNISGVPIPPTNGTLDAGLHVYQGTVQAPQFPFDVSGNFEGMLTITFAPTMASLDPLPNSLDLMVQQIDFKLDELPAELNAPSLPQNISTRANVGVDANVVIGGFIIDGTDPKMVVLRAIGPSLTLSGVPGVLADPTLELHDSTGATLATNDNWMDNSEEDQTTLTDHNLAPTDDLESAIVMTLDPGAYTAIVSGVGDTTGVALVEAYDIDDGTTDSKLANISTRGFVDTGDNVMIGGFILSGGGGGLATVVVRGIGPSLTDFGVTDALADPLLELHNGDGDVIDVNDNWMDDPNMQQVIDAGLDPSDPNESALFEILPPGLYTAVVMGADDSNPGGIALVESYNLDGSIAVRQ